MWILEIFSSLWFGYEITTLFTSHKWNFLIRIAGGIPIGLFSISWIFFFLSTCDESFSCTSSASEWTVPTTFIYGYQDWMNYQGAQEARKLMNVPCEIIRVPQVPLSLSLPFSLLDGMCRTN